MTPYIDLRGTNGAAEPGSVAIDTVADEPSRLFIEAAAMVDRAIEQARARRIQMLAEIDRERAAMLRSAEEEAAAVRRAADAEREASHLEVEAARQRIDAVAGQLRDTLAALSAASAAVEEARLSLGSADAPPPVVEAPPTMEVDIELLCVLEQEVGDEVFRDVVGTFVRDIEVQLANLEQARALGDHETVDHLLHTLSSATATVGAHRLAELCSEVTPGAHDDARLEEITRRCEVVRREVATLIG